MSEHPPGRPQVYDCRHERSLDPRQIWASVAALNAAEEDVDQIVAGGRLGRPLGERTQVRIVPVAARAAPYDVVRRHVPASSSRSLRPAGGYSEQRTIGIVGSRGSNALSDFHTLLHILGTVFEGVEVGGGDFTILVTVGTELVSGRNAR